MEDRDSEYEAVAELVIAILLVGLYLYGGAIGMDIVPEWLFYAAIIIILGDAALDYRRV